MYYILNNNVNEVSVSGVYNLLDFIFNQYFFSHLENERRSAINIGKLNFPKRKSKENFKKFSKPKQNPKTLLPPNQQQQIRSNQIKKREKNKTFNNFHHHQRSRLRPHQPQHQNPIKNKIKKQRSLSGFLRNRENRTKRKLPSKRNIVIVKFNRIWMNNMNKQSPTANQKKLFNPSEIVVYFNEFRQYESTCSARMYKIDGWTLRSRH